jgi:hypothetical protein
MPAFKTLNIEAGLPTVDEARRLLLAELRQAKQSGVVAVKIIYGYGSTGKVEPFGKLCDLRCFVERKKVSSPV